jgi:hypothetical protein
VLDDLAGAGEDLAGFAAVPLQDRAFEDRPEVHGPAPRQVLGLIGRIADQAPPFGQNALMVAGDQGRHERRRHVSFARGALCGAQNGRNSKNSCIEPLRYAAAHKRVKRIF